MCSSSCACRAIASAAFLAIEATGIVFFYWKNVEEQLERFKSLRPNFRKGYTRTNECQHYYKWDKAASSIFLKLSYGHFDVGHFVNSISQADRALLVKPIFKWQQRPKLNCISQSKYYVYVTYIGIHQQSSANSMFLNFLYFVVKEKYSSRFKYFFIHFIYLSNTYYEWIVIHV